MNQEQFEQLLQEQKRTNELLEAVLKLLNDTTLGGQAVLTQSL